MCESCTYLESLRHVRWQPYRLSLSPFVNSAVNCTLILNSSKHANAVIVCSAASVFNLDPLVFGETRYLGWGECIQEVWGTEVPQWGPGVKPR